MIGPFENVWEAQHEVERDIIASGANPPDPNRKYIAADGRPTAWREVQADSETGRVDLTQVFKTNGLAAAYAWLEIDSAEPATAKLLCGSDDQIALWLNGRKVHDQSSTRGFEPEKDEVPLQLAAGKNQLLVKIGNIGGNWEFAVRVPQLIGGKYLIAKEPAPDAKQRSFALAAKPDGSWVNAGDAARGAKLFHDPTAPLGGICATCHIAGGKGGQIGPDLSAVGVNYKRPDLITSIHEPNKTIALGYEQVRVETKGGETLIGALRNESAEGFSVVGADGNPHVVRKADIKSQQAIPASLMPAGLTLGLKPEEFVDLLAYLESLRGK
jgi:putative heme-binding domain-containing protein